ncbi:hypothetical protein [Salinibacter sp. 10B]|uniref:hypothetical protein n=1 Tax=Salinibacter sp. 10B TaxID=1923971 RepID=UPI0011B00281|nr:hypothetical protein [Salinibacter sp. 10B]
MPSSVSTLPQRSQTPVGPSPKGAWVWWGALLLFVLAGATGAVFRFGMVYGGTGPLELENVRHAHSHLMYFGWGTPALMVLIWRCLPASLTAGWGRAFRWIAGSTLAAAVLAYPPFLLFGYSVVQIGSVQMPIAVVGAGLNIIGWYGFVGLYIVVTYPHPRRGALRLWDVAVGALVLSTLGAWSLSLLPLLGVHSPLIAQGLTHVFLDLFSEGWFVLGGLGVAFAILEPSPSAPSASSVGLVVAGLPLTFLLSLPASGLSLELEVAGRIGGTLVALGLFAMGIRLVNCLSAKGRRWLWGVPLACVLLKAGAQLVGSLVPGLWLGEIHGLRILYLHLMLLGFLTLTLVVAAHEVWGGRNTTDLAVLYGAVGGVLCTLIPLTPWGPGGTMAFTVAAWASLGLVMVAGWMLFRRHPFAGSARLRESEFIGERHALGGSFASNESCPHDSGSVRE